MSIAGRAVFLSYASQDAEGARRICDALRAAGIEVWFDQSELRGGDAWDQKIRKQIKECALFVPVISANTQARTEGYFRLEWKLAVDRSHLMADDAPFIFPVVIDETSDALARVPDKFREVQWTRLNVKDTPESLAIRIGRLLRRSDDLSAEAGGKEQGARASRQKPKRWSPAWQVGLIAVGVTLLALGGLAVKRYGDSAAARSGGTVAAGVPLTEARKLAGQARALRENGDDANRENFTLAEELLAKAVSLDPTDGEALAVYAELSTDFVRFGFDRSDARRELARTQAERAVKLAPASFEAKFAQAYQYYPLDAREGERLIRELLRERPNDRRSLFTLGLMLSRQHRFDDAYRVNRQVAKLPGGDAYALREIAYRFMSLTEWEAADQALGESMRLQPMVRSQWARLAVLLYGRGDVQGARSALQALPAWALLEDRGAYLACLVHLWRREPDEAISALNRVPREYFADNWFTGPKSYLVGQAQSLAGRMEAARTEWQNALTLVEKKLSDDPRSTDLLYWRARTLAALGRSADAEKARTLYDESVNDPNNKMARLAKIDVLLGHADAAFGNLEGHLRLRTGDALSEMCSVQALRFDPTWEPLRGNPRYEKLVATPGSAGVSNPTGGTSNSEMSKPSVDSKSVAVLAFANLSDDKDNEYFSDGISEELLNVLAKVPGLKVSARTSAFSFKGKGVAIPEIARQLGVAYVVEGSVRKAGNRVRITAQLIKASDGFHIWSDNFDRELKDIFAVQDEIAGVIAKTLSLRMGMSSTPGPATIDPQVYEWYLQGREGWRQRNEAGYARAEALFGQVLQRQPDFARAHVGLSDVWLNRAQETVAVGAFSQRNSPALQRIRAAADRAMQLDAGLAEAHASFASVQWMEWKLDDAVRELRLALRLNPNDASAHQWLGRCLMANGEMAEALQELKLASELDPLLARIADNYSLTLLAAQRPQEALDLAERALVLQPDSIQALRFKIVALAELDHAAECRQAARRYASAGGDSTPYFVSYALARIGARTEAEEILGNTGNTQREPARGAALLALGRSEEWLAGLNPNDFNILTLEGMLFWPVFDPVRSDDRFIKLLDRLGVTDAHARAQAWRAANRRPDKKEAK